MSISCGADFADWFETEARNYRDTALASFVETNPNLIALGFYHQNQLMADIATGMVVDLARIGTGAASGTVGGAVHDIFRALSVLPVGSLTSGATNTARPIIGKIISFFRADALKAERGLICSPITIANALGRTGQKLFVPLETAANAMGRSLDLMRTAPLNVAGTRKGLVELGGRFRELDVVAGATLDDAMRMAHASQDFVVVTIKMKKREIAKEIGHTIGLQTVNGQVKIIDRAGIFGSVEELSRRYGAVAADEFWTLSQRSPLSFVSNWRFDAALAQKLNALGPLGAVVTQVVGLIGFKPGVTKQQASEALRVFSAGKSPDELYAKPVMPPEMAASMHVHEIGARIERKDWLSIISEKWYGDQMLWPVIFDFNRSDTFSHPKQMKPFMRIKVPFLPTMTAKERAAIRKRALDWK